MRYMSIYSLTYFLSDKTGENMSNISERENVVGIKPGQIQLCST